MKTAAARILLIVVALTSAGCSVDELGFVDEDIPSKGTGSEEAASADKTTTQTIGSEVAAAVTTSEPSGEPAESNQGFLSDGGDDEQEQVPSGPRLPVDSNATYRSGTCFQPPFPGAVAEEIPCDEPHVIEVFATGRLPEGGETPERIDATRLCNEEFSAVTGIGLGIATILQTSVIIPGEQAVLEGEREVTCYVVYPEPTTDLLTAIDPRRGFDLVSLYGLQTGDCLNDFDPSGTTFDLIDCDLPHDAEVFASYDLPAGVFPGPEFIEPLAASMCFGQGFADFIGLAFVDSGINALQSAPTAETWALGHHRINCIVTDGLVRTGSLAGAAR